MIDWYMLLVPAAVFGVLSLFRFLGCFGAHLSDILIQNYPQDVLFDNPVVYYRMHEFGLSIAHDETGHQDGQYAVSPSGGLLSGSDASTYLSLPVPIPSIHLGAPSVLPKDPGGSSVQFNGSQLFSGLPALPVFTVDALVHPEWDIVNERNFYGVIDYSSFVPGLGAPGPGRNAGFAIYAGPDNPLDLNSPICWQLWIGTGKDTGAGNVFTRAIPLDGSPGPLVSPEDTYLAVQFDATQAFLWGYTVHADFNQVRFALSVPPYVPSASNTTLRIGISFSGTAVLIPPFPGPPGAFLIYPFVGRMAELAVYNSVLSEGRICSHIMNAFDTT
jgi:hypothetical protein